MHVIPKKALAILTGGHIDLIAARMIAGLDKFGDIVDSIFESDPNALFQGVVTADFVVAVLGQIVSKATNVGHRRVVIRLLRQQFGIILRMEIATDIVINCIFE